jgi:hypothetical protein
MLDGICDRHGWIEVCARDWAECQDEGNQRSAGCDGIREQGDCDVASCETFSHDAGADHSGNEKRSA